MISLIVIDMQTGSFNEPEPRHEASAVVARINALARAVRRFGGLVVFVQHDGPEGDRFAPGSPDWELLPELDRLPNDLLLHKTACDAFCETELEALLTKRGVDELIVTGCATDFCVDTTIRAAASRDYQVTVAADGHTTANRPHLDAVSIIRHHNVTWSELIVPRRSVNVVATAAILERLAVPEC